MPNYRQDLADRDLGQKIRIDKQAENIGDELANQKIQSMVRAKQDQQMRDSHMRGVEENARVQGQIEGMDAAVGGLEMGSQTVDSIGQLGQVSQESLQEAAMPYFQQAIQALEQGTPPQEIDKMISEAVEPEVQGTLRQMLGQAMQEMQAQQQAEQQPQASGITPPPSMATEASKAIMAETGSQGQQQ